ncbi:MAG: RagB/SusD family nutrient uptake outer membrane protein [Bacteroidales bacterium]
MKNKYIISGLLLALLVGFQACTKDFLELEPKTNQSEANYYTNEAEAFLALTTVYDALSVQNWAFVPIMSDIYSDDAFAGGSSATDMEQWQDIEKSTVIAENNSASDLWNRCYTGIYRANLYLQKQDQIPWKTTGLKERYEAEAKFLRAYFYWDLVRHYGWVPIVTHVLTVDEAKNLPQNTPDEVYNQIASDLLASIAVIPETVPADEVGRVTKYAAQALLARIYLYHEGYAKVVLGTGEWTDGTTVINKAYATAALEEVINSGQYSLVANYADVFDWYNQNNEESVFEWQYSEKAKSDDWGGWGINGNFSVVFYGPRSPAGDPLYNSAGWSFATCTWSLFDEFEPGDPRLDASLYNADANMTTYLKAFMNTGYFNKKYMPFTPFQATAGTTDHNWARNYIDIRYADVLLMAAELNLGTNDAKALDYLNQVRTRSLGDGAALSSIDLDAIYHERRVELSGEGHRKWDLLRRGLSYTQTMINASFDIPGGVPNASDFANRDYKDGFWGMLPIPASELRNTNPGVLNQFVPAYQ